MSKILITREYPALWSVLAMVSASMDLPAEEQTTTLSATQLEIAERGLSVMALNDVLILAGIVEAEVRFGVLIETPAGRVVEILLGDD